MRPLAGLVETMDTRAEGTRGRPSFTAPVSPFQSYVLSVLLYDTCHVRGVCSSQLGRHLSALSAL